MGRERTRQGQHFYFFIALLVLLTGCGLLQENNRDRAISDTLRQGDRLLVGGDYQGSLVAFENVIRMTRDKPPADVAIYKTGVIYAHPDNPNRDLQKATAAFSRLVSRYPSSLFADESQAWIGVLKEAEASRKQTEIARAELAERQLELDRNRQAIEKSKQEIEQTRLQLEKTRQEIEKTRQVIEKSKQVDIEIDQKRRDRGR